MPPKLVSEGEGRAPITVIRPLVYCAEEDIRVFAAAEGFPILPCDLCGSQDNHQRKVVGRMIDDLERARPGTKQIMLAALQNVRPSQLLDRELWRKEGLAVAEDEKPSDVIPLSRLSR
jgi:tRNA 2-thiocytidine biosynthesis protein TtcA